MIPAGKTAVELLQEGRRWVEEGVYDAAQECAESALARSPADPEVLFLLGRISRDVERPASARQYFEQILAVDPAWNDGTATRALEHVRERLRDVEAALFHCEKWPCAEMFFSGAIWLRHLGRLEEALSSLDQAEASGWERDDVLRERGRIQMELANFQAAVDSFAEAFEIDPKLAHAWYGHAAALRKLGRYREALRSIERALELHPTVAARWLREVIADRAGPVTRS